MQRLGRGSCLFSNAVQVPKLDVAGSSPVSRSMFSIICMMSRPAYRPFNALIAVKPASQSLENKANPQADVQPRGLAFREYGWITKEE